MAYKFHYDKEDDILYIVNALKKVKESVEFSEDIVLDLDSEGKVIGVELFYASEFFDLFNKEIDKEFLMNLSFAGLEYKDYRNVWYVLLVLKSGNKEISQALPPLRKSEYVSPLIASCE
ncbi:MAG: DUF2283 domain-containing protein [Nanoarchaeota archaeon]|nr:DUF2283 domain-containing protein [Nanoarchaeota archaeon]